MRFCLLCKDNACDKSNVRTNARHVAWVLSGNLCVDMREAVWTNPERRVMEITCINPNYLAKDKILKQLVAEWVDGVYNENSLKE